MVKGRRYMPTGKRDGTWFPAINCSQCFNSQEKKELKEQLKLPEEFLKKTEIRTPEYKFSRHDNRHAFETDGEYFGHGLGKRKYGSKKTPFSDLLSWDNSSPITSTYTTFFRICKPSSSAPTGFRRFPTAYAKPIHGLVKLDTSTTSWFNEPYKTPQAVLAATQEPHLGHNAWRYSYKA